MHNQPTILFHQFERTFKNAFHLSIMNTSFPKNLAAISAHWSFMTLKTFIFVTWKAIFKFYNYSISHWKHCHVSIWCSLLSRGPSTHCGVNTPLFRCWGYNTIQETALLKKASRHEGKQESLWPEKQLKFDMLTGKTAASDSHSTMGSTLSTALSSCAVHHYFRYKCPLKSCFEKIKD